MERNKSTKEGKTATLYIWMCLSEKLISEQIFWANIVYGRYPLNKLDYYSHAILFAECLAIA